MTILLRYILSVASTPFFLKMPASRASTSGEKPVQPLIPIPTLVSCARAEPRAKARTASATRVFFMAVPLMTGR